MLFRTFNKEQDFPVFDEWWKKRGWIMNPEVLPVGTGFVVENNGVPIAAGWVYLTNSPLAWLEYVVTNPEAGIKERGRCVDLLLSGIIARIKEAGSFKAVFTSLCSRGLMKAYERAGFTKADTGMTNMVLGVV